MHISEGFLPIAHCIGWGVAALPPAVLSVRAVAKQMEAKRENRVLLAASAAFLFTLSSLRMPSITGSSSHPTGAAVGTYLVWTGGHARAGFDHARIPSLAARTWRIDHARSESVFSRASLDRGSPGCFCGS